MEIIMPVYDYKITWEDDRDIVVHNCDDIIHAISRALQFGRKERIVKIEQKNRVINDNRA